MPETARQEVARRPRPGSSGFDAFVRHKGCRSPGELRLQGLGGKHRIELGPRKPQRRQGAGCLSGSSILGDPQGWGVSRTLRERRGVLILSGREQGTERACRRGRRDSRIHDHADIHAGAERA